MSAYYGQGAQFRGCVLSIAAAQSIPTGVLTAVSFDAADIDTHALWDNAGGILIPAWVTAYRITACAEFDANATGYRLLAAGEMTATETPANATKITYLRGSMVVKNPSTVDHTILFNVLQDSGVALNLRAGQTQFAVELLT